LAEGDQGEQRREVNHLLDSSSILNLYFEGRYDHLLDASTTELAQFELGNAIWRRASLLKEISIKEAQILLHAINRLLISMGTPLDYDPAESMKIATEEHITYYDASYISAAKLNGVPLVTDDIQLLKVAKKHLNSLTSYDLLKEIK